MTKSKAEISDLYDREAPRWRKIDRLNNALTRMDRRRATLMGAARGSVLDVACGTGENFPHLSRAERIIGVDLSPGMIEEANRRIAELRLRGTAMVADAEELPFGESEFDAVVSALSSCTFPDPVAALREMGRVTRPGGKILLLEHGRMAWSPGAAIQDKLAPRWYDWHACRWNQDPLIAIGAAGLAIRRHVRDFFGVYHAIEAAAP